MSAEVVRYRLHIQLYEWKAGDTDEVFNANKAWGTPFLDLGVITLHLSRLIASRDSIIT